MLRASGTAADTVGEAPHRAGVSPTLYDAHEDARELAARLIAEPPYATLAQWLSAKGIGKPHFRAGLQSEADDVARRANGQDVEREMRRSLVTRTTSEKGKAGRKPDPTKTAIAARVAELREKDTPWKDIPERIRTAFRRSHTVATLQKYHREYQRAPPK